MQKSSGQSINRSIDPKTFPVIIRVTGGIGSGKSVLCRALEDLGATVFNADLCAKTLMANDKALRSQIQRRFGDAAYLPSGELNRKYLAETVFSDDEALRSLNAIVHPAVYEAFDAAVHHARAKGVRFLVYEAALLTDRGNQGSTFDLTVVVDSGQSDRIARVRRRDNVDEDDVVSRMNNQPKRRAYLDVADYVVVNDGTSDELASKATVLLRSIEENFIREKEKTSNDQ